MVQAHHHWLWKSQQKKSLHTPEPVWAPPRILIILVGVVLFGVLENLLWLDDKGDECEGFSQTHVVRQYAASRVLGLTPQKPSQALALVREESEKKRQNNYAEYRFNFLKKVFWDRSKLQPRENNSKPMFGHKGE